MHRHHRYSQCLYISMYMAYKCLWTNTGLNSEQGRVSRKEEWNRKANEAKKELSTGSLRQWTNTTNLLKVSSATLISNPFLSEWIKTISRSQNLGRKQGRLDDSNILTINFKEIPGLEDPGYLNINESNKHITSSLMHVYQIHCLETYREPLKKF